MANAHRTNVLVTSCLKTPVDPHTKAPLALYEREKAFPYTSASHMDNRDYEKEMEHDDSGSELGDRAYSPGKGSPPKIKDHRVREDHIDLHEFYFSNEEYYRKLDELKKAHLRTMAELEGMYRKKLELKGVGPLDDGEGEHRLPVMKSSPGPMRRLNKSHSALELRAGSALSYTSDEEASAMDNVVEKGLLSSPKEYIKNMWQDFKLSPPHHRHLTSSSLQSLPGDHEGRKNTKGKDRKKGHRDAERERWKPRTTVPKPFHMMVREAEKRRHGVKTRSEVELENAELRRRLEELTECQRKFRASPMPAHVRLPLFEELQERDEERRRNMREREEQRLQATQRPFSFLERERLKREQREEQLRRLQPQSDPERVKPFKAKPVPRAVYEAASGELMKEEQLYRAIKMQMRAKELLHSASMPPSMLARRLSARRQDTAGSEDNDSSSHRPKINPEVPDFHASYRRFQKQLEKRRDVKPVTSCEPFQLRTSQIASHHDRILADIEKDEKSPRATRWPYVGSGTARTPNSSLCSSLSGSLEFLPAKVTDTAKKRQEAVRKVLEQRRKAEEEEERWRERQKQRERKIQKMVSKRAQANDPHLALSQTCQNKLKEFRKQDLQRRKEYKEEMKEILQRVKGRPLLLEQVAQRNAKQAAEKRYTDALRGCGLSEDFVSSKVPKALRPESPGSASKLSDKESDAPAVYNKDCLNDYNESKGEDKDGNCAESGLHDHDGSDSESSSADCGDDEHHSDGGYHYSDDDDHDSEDSEHHLSQDDINQEGEVIKQC